MAVAEFSVGQGEGTVDGCCWLQMRFVPTSGAAPPGWAPAAPCSAHSGAPQGQPLRLPL